MNQKEFDPLAAILNSFLEVGKAAAAEAREAAENAPLFSRKGDILNALFCIAGVISSVPDVGAEGECHEEECRMALSKILQITAKLGCVVNDAEE